jgi:hypothetical protein
VQINTEYHQLLEMAPAFGVRALGTALVVILDSTDSRDKRCGELPLRSLPQN